MEHFYQDIQGYFDGAFLDIYREAVERAPNHQPSTFVEIGSWKGRSAAFMAVEIVNSGKPISLYCVDVWAGKATWSERHQRDRGIGACVATALANDPDIEVIYEIFCNNVAAFPFVFPVRKSSRQASFAFDDKTLDFVMIDASHDYEDVYDDIVAWTPKLRPGGMLAGDDYSWPGVWRAVGEVIGHRNVVRRGNAPTNSLWVRK
jgi:predicted O-methyltransferase YrrM